MNEGKIKRGEEEKREDRRENENEENARERERKDERERERREMKGWMNVSFKRIVFKHLCPIDV